jgi:ribosomal protein S18 acetylase RimI-like enzyme
MNLTIGPMTELDVEGAAVAIASGPVFQRYGLDRSSAIALLRSAQGRIFVAKVDDEVAGVAIYWTDGTMPVPAYLRILAVNEGKRGLGIGRALLRQVEADAYRRGPNMFLCCESTNVDARRLYEREGYIEVGPLPNFIVEGMTEVLYRKTLGPIRGYVRPN